jgi:hypothetical protein
MGLNRVIHTGTYRIEQICDGTLIRNYFVMYVRGRIGLALSFGVTKGKEEEGNDFLFLETI